MTACSRACANPNAAIRAREAGRHSERCRHASICRKRRCGQEEMVGRALVGLERREGVEEGTRLDSGWGVVERRVKLEAIPGDVSRER